VIRIRSYALFPLLTLLALVAGTAWLERVTRIGVPLNDGRNRHDPDFTAGNFTVRQLDETGKLKYALSASSMVHYPDDDSTEVTEPHLTYLASPPPMSLQARRATLSKDAKVIELIDDVRGRREAGAKSPPITFTSSALTVWPDDEIARTAAPVTLTQGRTVIAGVGMEADHLNMLFKLNDRVRATIHRQEGNR
jgi:lipopolysaccharide export system protein LptC